MRYDSSQQQTQPPAKGNTIMSQPIIPPQFKELIEAARFSAQSGVEVAEMLIQQDGGDARSNRVYLKRQQARAAEIERQIMLLSRMTGLFTKVLS
jgi:hypothetical protein